MYKEKRRKSDQPFTAPNTGGNIWPEQSCPAYLPREYAIEKTCWYCAHADFHLEQHRALDVGICCWPKRMMQ